MSWVHQRHPTQQQQQLQKQQQQSHPSLSASNFQQNPTSSAFNSYVNPLVSSSTSATKPLTTTPATTQHLMTSQQYSNKLNQQQQNLLATKRASGFQQQQQQPQPPPPTSQRPQTAATATSQSHAISPPSGNILSQQNTLNSINNNNLNDNSHFQGALLHKQQPPSSWQMQQTTPSATQSYLPANNNKMLPPNQQPPTADANNWQQQQNYQNANVYQQSGNVNQQQQQQQPHQQPQHWPTQQTSQTNAAYANYYQQQQQQQPSLPQALPAAATTHNVYQHDQHAAAAAAGYFQQQPQQQPAPPATQNSNAVNFFDNNNISNNSNNNIPTGDGWGDWDWNDNSIAADKQLEHSIPAAQHQPQPQQQQLQQLQSNATPSIIADSFGQQTHADSWNWDAASQQKQQQHNEQHVAATAVNNEQQGNSLAEQQPDNWDWESQQATAAALAATATQNSEQWNQWQNQQNIVASTQAVGTQQEQAAATTATALPIHTTSTEFSTENHNYNTTTAAAAPSLPQQPLINAPPSSIPSTVFVSQAKPVTLPSRQYASPPLGNTPVVENSTESALTPPQAFQNAQEAAANIAAASTALPPAPTAAATPPPPPPSIAPPSGLPPSAMPPSSSAAVTAANPFKRSGLPQHHRATGLMTSTAPLSSSAVSNVFADMPPPPPADFANPSAAVGVSLMEPDNNEYPLQENQEVLLPPPQHPAITLPNATAPPAVNPQQPPNDERNQYLQTSHLSENSEEQQAGIESDGLLPPPGLSRLVLGEPELEAPQRMVMGTDTPTALTNAVTVSSAMHLEERHADGEDTASEGGVASAISPPTTHHTQAAGNVSSDRNLYMVPGESLSAGSNQQRVVTGVELQEQREIELDGENLEDEPQPQQQQMQHHQQQNQQQQQQQQSLSPESRNEPPFEGADNNNMSQQQLAPLPSQHSHANSNEQHLAKATKDNQQVSTSANDDEDDSDERLLNDRVQNTTASSSKSRSKYEAEQRLNNTRSRREKQPSQQRSSVNRFDSDEYYNSEDAEYSSEREQLQERKEQHYRQQRRRSDYREGSVRSDRGAVEDLDDKRASRRSQKHDKYYYEGGEQRNRSERAAGERSKPDRRSTRQRAGGAYADADSRYETEESTRFDARKETARRSLRQHPEANERSRRSDQGSEYDDFKRRSDYRSSKRSNDNYDSYDRRDRRRSDKHRDARYREDPREYEEYRKHSSRNARESDMEKDVAGAAGRGGRMHDPRHAAMYGYPSGGYYDPYSAAYYYQQMARTNPQAYAEWYKKYYGAAGAGAVLSQSGAALAGAQLNAAGILEPTGIAAASNTSANDGRESVHSGRSSAHNDLKDRSGGVSMRDHDPIAQEPQRLTPCKFINEHAVVSFSSGILVTMKPKYTAHGHISSIVKLLKFKPNDETRKLFKVFPGPLVRGLTHKKTVIEFCQDQIRLGPMETTIYAKQLISNNADKYKASYTLLWNLLILLLKQNGMVVGTDIAELLLKNQQQYPYVLAQDIEKSKSGTASPLQDEESPNNNSEEKSLDDKEPAAAELQNAEESQVNQKTVDEEEDTSEFSKSISSAAVAQSSAVLSETEITEKFRNYLLYGNVNEALEWATDNNLWGHALFLASKLDRRSHANVMMKFANKLSLNDPLQTLYQLMSGRTPSSVTCIQDEKWGDWRPHLSMILSNTSQKPELDRKAITTLGDSLFNRGDLYAAHFCYLMAQVNFGRYQESATQETSLHHQLPKLVLLGSSHYKNFRDFAHNEAIVMTEIYEYACSLNDSSFSIVEYQPYKFLLATRLLDYGFHLKSLMYLEQIAVHISRDASKYETSFIQKVYELADRLKYYDPVLEKNLDDPTAAGTDDLNQNSQQLEEQKWLQNLRELSQQHQLSFNNNNATSTTASVNGDLVGQQQQPTDASSTTAVNYNYQQQQIDQQFMEINKQFSELNLQYQQTTDGNSNQVATPAFYNAEQMQQQQQQQQHLEQQQPALLDPYQQQQQHLTTDQQQTSSSSNANDYQQTDAAVANVQQQQYLQPDNSMYTQNYYDPTIQQQQQQQQSADFNDPSNYQQPSYDYWANQQQSQQLPGEELSLKSTESNADFSTNNLKDGLTGSNIALNHSAVATATPTAAVSQTKSEKPLSARKTLTPYATQQKKTIKNNQSNFQYKMSLEKTRKSALELQKKIQNQSATNAFAAKNTTAAVAPCTPSLATTDASALEHKNLLENHHPNVSACSTQEQFNHNNNHHNNNTLTSSMTTTATGTTNTPFTINNNARPTISMPKSKSYDTDDDGAKHKSAADKKSGGQQQQQQAQQKANKKEDSSKNQSQQNSGWFGGIFKFSLKPKNQMILPDDKNPTIVWDPEKKKWVNTDGEEHVEDTLKPPPKMSDLMPQQQQQSMPPQMPMPTQQQQVQPMQQSLQQQQIPYIDAQQQQYMPPASSSPNPISQQQQLQQPLASSTNPAPSTKTPNLQSNMFKMQRNRTLKNAYVDVFNPSGAPVNKAAENILAPTLPPAAVPQTGFFVPGQAPGQAQPDAGYQQQQQQQQPQQDIPQFYNPQQYGGAAGGGY